MRILVGVAEHGAPQLLAELDRLVSLLDTDLVLVHVIDNGARGEMGLARGRLLPRPIPKDRLRAIGEAERRAAELALEEAATAAKSLAARPDTLAAEGEPGRVVSRLAEERSCDLVASAARADLRNERPGPRSVGHTARFVLDHSPRPVLLLHGPVAVA
ncbi:MAG: universal stress protein [Candidatus Dormibacteraeota bacterium]|nr:universal stress protein [Candidatus Dormibacteraeota bacterium]MDQ6920149.1 universal stress protein [Candidatus Dormibacteraeota bacterium]